MGAVTGIGSKLSIKLTRNDGHLPEKLFTDTFTTSLHTIEERQLNSFGVCLICEAATCMLLIKEAAS
jgi:hypothetical protein